MNRRSSQRGSVVVLSMILVCAAVVMCLGVARVGLASVLRTRAENAADSVALAAADQLALGNGSAAAKQVAAEVAHDNGAKLLECDCEGSAAEVAVELDLDVPIAGFPAIQGRSRAEVGS